MDALQRISEINELLAPGRLGLSLPFNRIEKTSHVGYANFGIEVTPQNRGQVAALSMNANIEEWATRTIGGRELAEVELRAQHELIGCALNETIHGSMDALNDEVGYVAAHLLLSRLSENRAIEICDLGTGTGNTVRAILNQAGRLFRDRMGEKEGNMALGALVERTRWVLNDVSAKQLEATREMLEVAYGLGVATECGWSSLVLRNKFHKRFDLIVSNANMHHESFPEAHVDIRNALRDDGAAIIGDFHTRMYDHPARLIGLLEALRAEEGALADLRRYFSLKKGAHFAIQGELRHGEQVALALTISYISSIMRHTELSRLPGVTYNPVEAVRSSRQMRGEMSDAGIIPMDLGEVRKAFPGSFGKRGRRRFLRLEGVPASDVAWVTFGVKKPHLRAGR